MRRKIPVSVCLSVSFSSVSRSGLVSVRSVLFILIIVIIVIIVLTFLASVTTRPSLLSLDTQPAQRSNEASSPSPIFPSRPNREAERRRAHHGTVRLQCCYCMLILCRVSLSQVTPCFSSDWQTFAFCFVPPDRLTHFFLYLSFFLTFGRQTNRG